MGTVDLKVWDEYCAAFAPHFTLAKIRPGDGTASIEGVKRLQAHSRDFTAYYIPKARQLTHGGLVLNHDVIGADGAVCTPRNALFDPMMARMTEFIRAG